MSKLETAMREVHNNVPRNVKKTGKTGAAKEAMIRAIAFSKARAAGAKIPMQGGSTKLKASSMKYEFLKGRQSNLAAKAEFKAGANARTCPNAGSTGRTDNAAAEEVQ
jgi:hypothetical protein